MNKDVIELVKYRFERAVESIQEAELLLGAGHTNSSVNRMYYACFYSVSAILLTKGFSASKHSGIRSLFHQKVIKTGLVEVSLAYLYDRLYDSRQKSDYADLVVFDVNEIEPWIEEVKMFVSKLREIVNEDANTGL